VNAKDQLIIKFGVPIITSIIVFGLVAISVVDVDDDQEWSNNATLIAEVGVGIVVTLFVLLISKISEQKMDEKVTDVLDIIKAREEIQKEKELQIHDSVLSTFKEIKIEIKEILEETELYLASENDNVQQKYHENQIILGYEQIKNTSLTHLDDPDKISSVFFEPVTVELIKTISSTCKNKPDFTNVTKSIISNVNTLLRMIEPLIFDLSSISKENILKHPDLEENVESGMISVLSDRTVYPLDSTMHMRANLPSLIIGKKILFEVFNSERKLLISQTVDPENNDHPNLAEGNIFQACFKMEGKEWKIDESYIVRATYGSSYSEDTFLIAQRTPVLQSDKSVYTINGDMILTVIDPDADKDNEVAESVGDTDDSKVIIQSKSGKIDGYKLIETGDSTGIFQGVIGFLGARKDGTIIPNTIDGKIIDKIQGTGIEDGFIAGEPEEEIIISYKNKTSTIHLSVLVSNFGAVVEMDQKVYKSNDKMHLTVVAPDFSFDSDVVNEIGQTTDNSIQIRTSDDELVNYKLVETGTDTGIFTGEIQLTPINYKSLKMPKTGLGPIDGHINCRSDDFIEVTFNFFDYEKIIGKALIKNEK